VVILDSNALYGQNAAFTNTFIQELTSLADRGSIRLVVPKVVLLELSRQWEKSVRDARAKLDAALAAYNSSTAKGGVAPSGIDAVELERETFFDEAARYLRSVRVELPGYPATLSIAEVLERDLDYRKPFDEKGKGFRDALIWETVRALVADVDDATAVIFVTDNWSDFQEQAEGPLHSDLQIDVAVGRTIDVLPKPKDVLSHPEIKPLVDAIEAAEGALTPSHVLGLAETAMDDLANRALQDVLGVHDGDGTTYLPIKTPLIEPEISGYGVDPESVSFKLFHTAGLTEMGLRVTATVECELDGYLDRSDATFYYDDNSPVHVNGEWNRWTVTATDTRILRIEFGASFSPDEIDVLQLEVEHVEDITDNVRIGA